MNEQNDMNINNAPETLQAEKAPVNTQNAPNDGFEQSAAVLPAMPLNRREYSLCDTVFALICIALGFVFTHFVCRYAGGLWGGIFWLVFGLCGAVFLRKKGVKVSARQTVLFAVAEVFSLVPVFSGSALINTLAAVYTFVLLCYVGITISGAPLFGQHFVGDIFRSVFERTFKGFSDQPRAAVGIAKRFKSGKTVAYVVVGLLLAVPLTIVVVVLLISSDSIFESVFGDISRTLFRFDGALIPEIIFAFPVAMFLFGIIFSASQRFTPDTAAPGYRFMPAPVAYAAVTPMCVFYLMYLITQLSYIGAAFGGSLPEGVTHSEFARRGFFELCVIAVINLFIIVIMQSLVRRNEGDRRPAALSVYTIVICVFTLCLIGSAMAKMVLYIREYGMTVLRIYPSWFMALLAIVFAVIIVWQIKDFRVFRVLFAAFTVMFAVLCFGDFDGMIANYNVTAYETGALESFDLWALSDLDPTAARYAARLADDKDLQSYDRNITECLSAAKTELSQRDDFAYFSVPKILAEQVLNDVVTY